MLQKDRRNNRFSLAPAAYKLGIVLVAMKAHAWSTGIAHLVWIGGKVVSVLIVMAFFTDTYASPRSRGMQSFWILMMIIVPWLSISAVLSEMKR